MGNSDDCKDRQAKQEEINHLFRIAACLDGLENGSHVSVTETERARLAIERVANIEQWRGDACLASRVGGQAIVLEDVRDRCLDREIPGDEFRRLLARDGSADGF